MDNAADVFKRAGNAFYSEPPELTGVLVGSALFIVVCLVLVCVVFNIGCRDCRVFCLALRFYFACFLAPSVSDEGKTQKGAYHTVKSGFCSERL